MTQLEDFLKTHHAGKLLDIACGSGGFTRRLSENLASYDSITGLDIKADARDDFFKAVPGNNVAFLPTSIHDYLATAPKFNTITVSNALHHLENVGDVLKNVRVMLEDDGTFIVNEMHRDDLTPTQQTQYEQHRFLADLQREAGEYHRGTWTKKEILGFVEDAKFTVIQTFETLNRDAEPSREPGRIVERARAAIEKAYPDGAPDEIQERLSHVLDLSERVGSSPPPQLTLVCRGA